ncbi:response regulator [Rhizobium leguminosarum bv. trifolii WSM2297]|uniref:Response regulator n=1 Tax=Rhizobium leguminosarum bv. trifolii WSM2297 TaxID=754762 RepID=J0W3F0_RHILT|nr:response regulator [Rhizobium leguminosarum]EJC80226.1 response regulator [Rhizobium leguminosarum bv. trifolii WSM2297]
MTDELKLVAVVDDDESVREALPDLLRALGVQVVEAFASARSFLSSPAYTLADCLVLDVAMREMSGPELQQELKTKGRNIPIIFITAIRDEDLRRRLLREGAVDCLTKPFSDDELHEALRAAKVTKT